MNVSDRPRTTYEVTVVGRLGPVLQAMARRAATTPSETERVTILRVRARDDEDLVDVLHRLKVPGAEVTGIRPIAPRD